MSHGKYIEKVRFKKSVLELEQTDSGDDGGGTGKYILLTITKWRFFFFLTDII